MQSMINAGSMVLQPMRRTASSALRSLLMLGAALRPRNAWRKHTRLEIGAGPAARRPGWLTLDYCRGANVVWNLNKKLPFPDRCFDVIYSSHVLEHFKPRQLDQLLGELHRVLKPGGTMLICVPDASRYVRAYLERDPHEMLQYQPAVLSDCPMDYLNYIFYMDGHHHMMFDQENLARHVERAGFTNCRPRPFDPLVDSEARRHDSLYAACDK